MNKELHKRIEEATEQALQLLGDTCYIHIDENTECAYKDGYKDGAERGYKEAITQAKEWLMNYFFFDNSLMSASGCDFFLRTFEAYMNKLMEEKK